MTAFISFTDIQEVMDADDLARLGITSGATAKLDRAGTTALNEIMGVVGRRKVTPVTLPTAGGSRWAFLVVTRFRLYSTKPELLIVTSPGGGMRKHPVVTDYDNAMAQAASVAAWGNDWAELTDLAGMDGAWGSDKRIADAWDRIDKQGDGADSENANPFGDIPSLSE